MLEGKRAPNDLIVMEMLSREYHWTPSEIRDQLVNDIMDYLDIIRVRALIEKVKQKRYGTK